MKSEKQKIKLLRILEILRQETDEQNPMSTNQLIQRLEDDGIMCGRKALYDDIALLCQYGYEIMTVKSRNNKYYVVDRTFDVPELRILMDAIHSAGFITKKKTRVLASKIAALAGTHRGELLKSTTVYFDTLKHTNEAIFYWVDAIDRAIGERKKLSFVYFDLDAGGNKVYRRNKERYVVNPVGLIFSHGFYYFVCFNDKRLTLTNYRVDRMDAVEILDQPITVADCIKEFADYKLQNVAFEMFSGTVKNVVLSVDPSLTEVIFDKFGIKTTFKQREDGRLVVTVKVQLSPVFFSWCAMFGDKLKIESPTDVVEEFLASLKRVTEQYGV